MALALERSSSKTELRDGSLFFASTVRTYSLVVLTL